MKNSISRRSFLKAVGALSAAGALAACGGSSSSSTAASSTAASAAASTAAGANIKLWTYPIGGWGKDETVQELIASFNAKYPDIKVAVEYLDYTNGDDQVNTAIEGGSAPAALIIPTAFKKERREMAFFIISSPYLSSYRRSFIPDRSCWPYYRKLLSFCPSVAYTIFRKFSCPFRTNIWDTSQFLATFTSFIASCSHFVIISA